MKSLRLKLIQRPIISTHAHTFSTSTTNTTTTTTDPRSLKKLPSFSKTSAAQKSPLFRSHSRQGKTAEEAVNNLLYNLPASKPLATKHTLSVFVDNEAGVLSKVSGLLSARGFNIDSLSVANTDVKSLSRMTIVLKGAEEQIEQAKRQLQDLCDVWAVLEHKPSETFERELCLAKVSTVSHKPIDLLSRAQIQADEEAHSAEYDSQDPNEMYAKVSHLRTIVELFGGSIRDVGSESVIVELVSWSRRVDAFLKMLQPFGVIEAARTGVIAMTKSKVTVAGVEDDDDDTSGKQEVDLASLPPS